MWAFGLSASLFGGWYYLWNLYAYGYLYPHGLEVHSVMFRMPPGEREILDYLRFPISTFTDPQLLSPSLLRSVWGSTYVTLWFDGHRSFLPNESAIVRSLDLEGLGERQKKLRFVLQLERTETKDCILQTRQVRSSRLSTEYQTSGLPWTLVLLAT